MQDKLLVDEVKSQTLVVVVGSARPVVGGNGSSQAVDQRRDEEFVDGAADVLVEKRADSLSEGGRALHQCSVVHGSHEPKENIKW